jgi:hypothetical protein
MAETSCDHCHGTIPDSEVRCPHCGLPGLFPNVRAAQAPAELNALERRYADAVGTAVQQGSADVVRALEAAVAGSRAVINKPLREVQRLASSDKELYATFYELVKAGIRLPGGDKWNRLRVFTDDALFPGYKEQIRFAALSLDGKGVSSYGECTLVLRDHKIAHRASVFEGNSVVWMSRQQIKFDDLIDLPKGYRALWHERGKLAVAKLAVRVQSSTQEREYAGVLLQQGKSPEDDDFVEVHIWGPMSALTFERIVVSQPAAQQLRKPIVRALSERLAKAGVSLEIQ